MKIEFINHSSFIIEYKDVKLICDPWLEGTAFDNGWGLLSKSEISYARFNEITHIWFSHEHPDHFSPPNLNKIPLAFKNKMTVLFQETADRKVFDYCKKNGFGAIVELKKDEYFTIFDDLRILCNPYTDGDSYALFSTNNHKILNLNDCIVNTSEKAEELAKITGEVDVLFTQFGYANKVGNENEIQLRIEASNEKLERIRHQVRFLKPKAIVPFASFIYFCHEENDYMNKGLNRIDKVSDFVALELNTPCVVLYPGDRWECGKTHDSLDSLEKYNLDYENLNAISFIKTQSVDLNELKEKCIDFMNRLKKNNTRYRRDIGSMHANIYITDYGRSFSMTGRKGLTEINMEYQNCDIALSSEALYYCFKFLWGFGTLNINARFQTPKNGDYSRISRFMNVALHINRGEAYAHLFDPLYDKVRFKIKHELNKLTAILKGKQGFAYKQPR